MIPISIAILFTSLACSYKVEKKKKFPDEIFESFHPKNQTFLNLSSLPGSVFSIC